MGCEHTLDLVDSLCAGLFGEEFHLNPFGIIINDGQVGPAVELKKVHLKVCPWTIWEGQGKQGFHPLWTMDDTR